MVMIDLTDYRDSITLKLKMKMLPAGTGTQPGRLAAVRGPSSDRYTQELTMLPNDAEIRSPR